MQSPATPSPVAPAGLHRLAVVSAIGALVVVAVGGAVRATESGLACPTWPGCFSAGDFLPPKDLNVWLEHSHRLFAGALALALAAQAAWALARLRSRGDIVWPAVVAAAAVVAQALLGALVVMELLRAELVTAHLGLAMAVVACQLVLAVTTAPSWSPSWSRRGDRHPLAGPALGVAALTYAQILVGGHVTGIGAGLVFDGSPVLGLATFTPVESEPAAFNIAHRVLGVVVLAAVVWLGRRARAVGATGWLGRLPRVAAVLVGVQVLLGVANLWSGLSFLSVIPHLAVASWLWAVLVLVTVLAWRVAAVAAPDQRPRREPELASSAR